MVNVHKESLEKKNSQENALKNMRIVLSAICFVQRKAVSVYLSYSDLVFLFTFHG